jgi:hypothetical protein
VPNSAAVSLRRPALSEDFKTEKGENFKAEAVNAGLPHIDLAAGALEMTIVKLNAELSQVIDEILKSRLQSQQDRNTQIDLYNELLNELRKIQKSDEPYSVSKLEEGFKSFPPDSPLRKHSLDRMHKAMEEEISAAKTTEQDALERIVADAARQSTWFGWTYDRFRPEAITSEPDGGVTLWKRQGDGQWFCLKPIYPKDLFSFYPNHWINEIKGNFQFKATAIKASEDKYKAYEESAKMSLADMLIGYGVYKNSAELPKTKEQLEAANEKISAMISSINSIQTLKMTEINKFTNSRNEAYDMAVKINNSKIESLNALIRLIGEHS